MAKSSQIVKNQHSCIIKNRKSVTALEEKHVKIFLLTDAEILEDVDQDVLGGDFADYGAEAVDG